MIREQMFGGFTTLAVLDRVSPGQFPTFAKGIAAEFSLRAKDDPDDIGERMGRASDRYVFL